MLQEKTTSGNDLARNRNQEIRQEQKSLEDIFKDFGLDQLENGQIISKKQNG